MKLDRAMLALRHACSDDETRIHLCGIQIEPEVSVATDGHFLAAVANLEPEAAEAFPVSIGSRFAAEIEKAIPKTRKFDPAPTIDVQPCSPVPGDGIRRLSVTIGEGRTMSVEDNGGTFPDWRKVVLQEEPTFKVSFNLDYLDRLAKVIKAASDDPKESAKVVLEFFGDPNDSLKQGYSQTIRVTSHQAPRFCGLLMPMHT